MKSILQFLGASTQPQKVGRVSPTSRPTFSIGLKISRLAFGIPTLVDLEAILFNLVSYGELTGSLPGMEAPGHFVENSVAFGKFPDMIMRTIQLVHIRLIENKFTFVNAWNEFTNVNAKPDIDKTSKVLVYLGINKKESPRSQDEASRTSNSLPLQNLRERAVYVTDK